MNECLDGKGCRKAALFKICMRVVLGDVSILLKEIRRFRLAVRVNR